MSVRVYTLSKQLGMENSELIALLGERGFTIKSASSTIDNISADSLIEEFAKKAEASVEQKAPATVKEEKTAPALPKMPVGAIVKSKEDIDREREEKIQAKKKVVAKPAAVAPPVPTAAVAAPSVPVPPPTPGAAPVPPAVPTAAAATGSAPIPPVVKAAPPVGVPAPAVPGIPAPVAKAPAVKEEEEVSVMQAEQEEAPAESGAEGGKVLSFKPPIVLRDFALAIDVKPFRLISELMEMGIFASMTQSIEEDVAAKVAERHGFVLEVKHRGESQSGPAKEKSKEEKAQDEEKLMKPRPPVACIMGHVDHGKTTLLDTIRKANVVKGEAGGITQHIGAYQIEFNDQKIAFIDTPGHAAFSRMRTRGTMITDIVILVIAADDGFKPQTVEALEQAQKAGTTIMVAINKIDAKGANVDKVKTQLQERGLAPEDWGGETIVVEVSALNGDGIDNLLEMILLQAEVLELRANPTCKAEGVVLESKFEVGRGPVASLFVQKGTLKKGDALYCGTSYCRVRAMTDDMGQQVKQAGPGTPVSVLGWSEPPRAGTDFATAKNEREAKKHAEETLHREKLESHEETAAVPQNIDTLFAAIAGAKQNTLRLVVKADVQGTVEALVDNLKEIKSDKVGLEIIRYDVGQVTQKDVMLASAAGAHIVAFGVKPETGVPNKAKHEGVEIYSHAIIYELFDMVKEAMTELIEPEFKEVKLGVAEVRQIFPVSKGKAAGSMVTEGLLRRDGMCRIYRKKELLAETKIKMLRRFKDDVTEVRAGYECGIQVAKFNDFEEGDTIECFQIEKIKPSL